MAVLALVPAFAARSAQVALLYLLLGLQFSAASFYEPGGWAQQSRSKVGSGCAMPCRAAAHGKAGGAEGPAHCSSGRAHHWPLALIIIECRPVSFPKAKSSAF